jgi:hypothetical protein
MQVGHEAEKVRREVTRELAQVELSIVAAGSAGVVDCVFGGREGGREERG